MVKGIWKKYQSERSNLKKLVAEQLMVVQNNGRGMK